MVRILDGVPSLFFGLWLLASAATPRPIASRNWMLVGPVSTDGQPLPVESVALDLLGDTLYIGIFPTSQPETRVLRRPIDGDAWTETPSPNLGGLLPFVRVATDPSVKGVVYAAGGTCFIHPPGCGGGLSRTSDEGASWTRLLDQVTSTIAIDPSDSRSLYAVVNAAVPNPMFPSVGTIVGTSLKSGDGGATWAETSVPPGVFAFDVTRPGTVFGATGSQGVWKSLDSGGHWVAVNDGLADLRTNAIAVDRAGVLHAATGSGVFVSSDGGEHWEATGLPQVVSAMVVDPRIPGAVYAADFFGVARVDENGIATPLGSGISDVMDLAIDPDGLRLWAATSGGLFEFDIREPVARIAAPRVTAP